MQYQGGFSGHVHAPDPPDFEDGPLLLHRIREHQPYQQSIVNASTLNISTGNSHQHTIALITTTLHSTTKLEVSSHHFYFDCLIKQNLYN